MGAVHCPSSSEASFCPRCSSTSRCTSCSRFSHRRRFRRGSHHVTKWIQQRGQSQAILDFGFFENLFFLWSLEKNVKDFIVTLLLTQRFSYGNLLVTGNL